MARETYTDLIKYVEYRTGVSYNRAWLVLKEYSDVIKYAVQRGNSVEIEGLVDITFTTTEGYIYKNTVYGLDEQVEDISKNLKIDSFEVRNIVNTYLKRMYDRLIDGYQVNIKGICYMIPEEDRGVVICSTRNSPVLKKPELADFILTTDSGLVLKEVEDKDLRFKVDAKEEVEILYEVASEGEKGLNLKEVNV